MSPATPRYSLQPALRPDAVSRCPGLSVGLLGVQEVAGSNPVAPTNTQVEGPETLAAIRGAPGEVESPVRFAAGLSCELYGRSARFRDTVGASGGASREGGPIRRGLIPFALQPVALLLGVGLLAIVGLLPDAADPYRPAALVALFGALYLGLAKATGSARAARDAWRPRGLLLLLPGVVAGALIQAAPPAIAGQGSLADRWDGDGAMEALGAASVAGTALAVLWEELWFRNALLDRVVGARPRLAFAAFHGLLFTAIHLLNPRFSLPGDGPEVLAAGTFLTMAYFAGGTFYLPLGLHFGNNLAGRVLDGALGPGGREALEGDGTGWVRTGLLLVGVAAAAAWSYRAGRDGRGSGAEGDRREADL
jgi:membrane protease YdiL (CAAX protease family)